MKTIILKATFVVMLLAGSVSLHAFTAVASGSWSNAATWGGVGPGNSVSNQDIIIPSGITVDMDVDVAFSGLINSFTVDGTLNSAANHNLLISSGSFAGNGTTNIRRLSLNSALAAYTYSGFLSLHVFRNMGSTVPLSAQVIVSDTLDLDAGSMLLNSGANMTMMMNSNVRVNGGSLTSGGGLFTTGNAYDVWYVGTTKNCGIEVNSITLRDMYMTMNDNAQTVTLGADMTVNGTLHMNTGQLALNGHHLVIKNDLITGFGAMFQSSGASDLTIDGAAASLTDGLTFAAGSSLDELIIDRNTSSVKLLSDLTVTGAVRLLDGNLRLETNSNLIMGSGSTISIVDGNFIQGGGTFDGTASYNVEYIGTLHNSNIELTGSGLNNVTVNMASGGLVLTLMNDVTVSGAFNLFYGKADLNGNTLLLNGTFNHAQGGSFMGNATSALELNMTSSVNDTIWFDSSSPALGDLVVNLPAGSTITLGSNLSIHNELTLTNGRIDAGDAVLSIRSTAAITGNTDLNYVVTSGTGGLRMWVNLNAAFLSFPIGTMNEYAPAGLHQSSSAVAGYFTVRVIDGVWTNGSTGTDISTSESVVGKTWLVQEDPSVTTIDMNLRLSWILGSELNGFDRTQSYISHYINNAWDSYGLSAAVTGSNNTYYSVRTGLTSLSPFAVVDSSVPLSVPEVPLSEISLYPNPSLDFVTINNGNINDTYMYELFDASGKRILSISNSQQQNQLDLRNYENGFYLLRITNLRDNSVVVKEVVKSK